MKDNIFDEEIYTFAQFQDIFNNYFDFCIEFDKTYKCIGGDEITEEFLDHNNLNNGWHPITIPYLLQYPEYLCDVWVYLKKHGIRVFKGGSSPKVMKENFKNYINSGYSLTDSNGYYLFSDCVPFISILYNVECITYEELARHVRKSYKLTTMQTTAQYKYKSAPEVINRMITESIITPLDEASCILIYKDHINRINTDVVCRYMKTDLINIINSEKKPSRYPLKVLQFSKPVDLIITDPCYIRDANYNIEPPDLETAPDSKYPFIEHSTIYGDWSCSVFDMTKENPEPVGEFCADGGMVCITTMDFAREWIKDVDYWNSWVKEYKHCVAVIPGFTGTAQITRVITYTEEGQDESIEIDLFAPDGKYLYCGKQTGL